ncbi:glycogen/starch/alpha-glucan family phosphorylase [Lacticaseibacillus mingshuiensis]|uniref:glycogen/starch/alpha-glucan family phosphorylase n=1 Tax=Lacticaseibacillus mingshuiensis TaxID=2799574 RepID=UPI00194F7CE9|nr:glycogen/starch/alpha-glucan family phosphorylase [Lacticaseibacillus mingshuiensis]
MNLTKEQVSQLLHEAAITLFADSLEELPPRQQYQALAFVVKGLAGPTWAAAKHGADERGQKQVYYFAIEFMPGRLLASNLLNLGILEPVEAGLRDLGLDPAALYAEETEPGLGNGGLGRLGSAFLDAMAAVGIVGNGNGIRYDQGLFEQRFVDGYQVELPDDWLRDADVWETRKADRAVIVRFGGQVLLDRDRLGQITPVYRGAEEVFAVPYDTAIIGYHQPRINTMRLWHAEPVPDAPEVLTAAARARITAITETLYPDDSNLAGQELRLRQEYFFVSAGLQSIVAHFLKYHKSVLQLPKYVAVHINDTHPALAVAELMRLLLDEHHLSWESAWQTTVATLSYTNHTLLPEALEQWPVDLLAAQLPRLWQLIQEIDRRFRLRYTGPFGQLLVDRAAPVVDGQIKMAALAVIGSHTVNGVAKLHTQLLKTQTLKELATIFPARFVNKTNGITPRRWLQLADAPLAGLLDVQIGPGWRTDARDIAALADKQDDPAVLDALIAAKQANKVALAGYIQETLGLRVSPAMIFDVQIKRMHAYKRQLLHVLGILEAYQALRAGEKRPPRLHIFAAKAAPSYTYAKDIIKLINTVADLVNHDPAVNGALQVAFLPNYNVSLAEKIVPAADISEQISLAGMEASGTSNMKLMTDGAITLATLDGANIEIAEAVGTSNIALFGMTAEEVAARRTAGYDPAAIAEADPRLKKSLGMLIDGSLPLGSAGHTIYESLLVDHDEYFVLADYASYIHASRVLDQLWTDPHGWAAVALQNIAASGRFSADDTVRRYAKEIWHALPARGGQEKWQN